MPVGGGPKRSSRSGNSDYWNLDAERAVCVSRVVVVGWEFGQARRKRVSWSKIRVIRGEVNDFGTIWDDG